MNRDRCGLYLSSFCGVLGSLLVNFTCANLFKPWHPDIWSNIILDISVKAFLKMRLAFE